MRNGARRIKIFIAVIFIFMGSVFGFVIPGIITANKAVCTQEETAVIVDIREKMGDDMMMYSPVYEVEVDGETKTLSSNAYSSSKPNIGDVVTIMLNPDNTDQFYVPGGVEDFIASVFSAVGYVFLGVGFVLMFVRKR